MDRDTNQPHLVRLVDEELLAQYFVAVEQIIHVEVSGIMQGMFLLLALHYVYDIEYHHRLKDFFCFFENKLLGMSRACKSPTYCSVTSALEGYLPSMD